MNAYLLSIITVLFYASAFGQVPMLKAEVSWTDKMDVQTDKEFGVGDDGIYNIAEPTVTASSELKESTRVFQASNLSDFNLSTPWIEGKPDYGVGEYIEFSFDLRKWPGNSHALSINSFFIINGYRKSLKTWKENSRVKILKMFIDGKPLAYILLQDTYKFQSIKFPEQWFNYGSLSVVRLEVVETFPGDKYKDTAISEIQFQGSYSGNMNN